MEKKRYLLIFIVLTFALVFVGATQFSVLAWTDVAVTNDPLVRMPGTQPGDVNLPDSGCSCHEFTSTNNEAPVDGWRGSMMAQSGRDFLFLATMTVAAQDAIWAVGNPNATDICIRCHFPVGWVNGHSDPTNASLMEKGDFDGVQCTLCHYIFDPFFEDTYAGTREGNDWLNYWDETNASDPGIRSQDMADAAYLIDQGFSANFFMFNGDPFFDSSNHKPSSTYTENASGQFFVGSGTNRRGSYADTTAGGNHQWVYSRYHKSKYFCATCHDISNPVLANSGQDGSSHLTTETDPAYSYYHVERTFSEFMLSDYGDQDGAEGLGPFAPDVFNTSQQGNKIASCQDCHMHDVTGVVASGGVNRPTDSLEHPNSGISVHDLTGGSVWVPTILASTVTGQSYSDATNQALLDDRFSELTLDLSINQSIGFDDTDALIAGADRSLQMLQMAAVITDVLYSPFNGNLSFIVQNQTGHKLISGYPEGRRMFINIKYYDGDGVLIYEVNPYDDDAGTLKGLNYPYTTTLTVPATMTSAETYVDELVYEMHGSSSAALADEQETFHFVLSDGRYKDNRIPPKGFDIGNADDRLSEPVWQGASAPDYFTAEEYNGGYDQVSMDDFEILVTDAVTVEVTLNYQSTSREYVEFLRNEINGSGATTLSGTGAGGDPPYLIQDPNQDFFDGLRAWGDTIWDVWVHNMDNPGAAPITIAFGQWDSSSVAEATVTLSAGWNLFTLEMEPETAFTAQSMLEAINAQGGNCAEVDRWYSGLWDPHLVGYPSINNFFIEAGQGYFLRCTLNSNWSYQGTTMSAGITLGLSSGWNLVGVPHPSGYDAQSLLEEIQTQGGDCPEVDRWFSGLWDPHLVGYPSINNFSIEPDQGYFLRCTQNSTFTPATP